jgi:thymidylate synthase (FAD)
MSVLLIRITPDPEPLILYIARVSSDQKRTDVGLLRYLVRMGHWSPFMHAYATMQIDTSRTISHQIIRHWTMACLESGNVPGVQEFSQRYAPPTHTIKYQARMAGASNRQSSIDNAPEVIQERFLAAQEYLERLTFGSYNEMIDLGIAPESARFLLLESTTTRIYLSGSIRSWIHYFAERCTEATQLEHREIALSARALLSLHLPTVSEALGWLDPEVDDGESEPAPEFFGYSGP